MRKFVAAPVFTLGFRPFFLAGAGFAAIAVAVWGLWLYGWFPAAQPVGGMLVWHRHEMPFGFASAIIGGFLLTAVPNWTGRPRLHGGPLIGLLLVWLTARLAWWLPMPSVVLMALQIPFLPLLAWLVVAALAMALWHAGLIPQQSLATHSLAVGGIGGLILAMIARVSLGHTGLPLQPSKAIILGFALLSMGAICRVLLVPFSTVGLGISALLWCVAFGLFLMR